MGIRLSVGIAALLIAILASDVRIATAGEPGRLAALTVRQELRDEVCIALAKGHISRADRYTILADARAVLKPAEYEGLKRAMDRLSPPQPITVIRTPMVVAKKAAPPLEQPASLQAEFTPELAPKAESSFQLTDPTDASLPDQVVWATDMR